jgi:hypothetical protein
LIWGEQGVGDEIMFAGLIPDVIRTGNRCVLDCDARLKPLFARSFPGIDVVSCQASGDDLGNDPRHDPELDIVAHTCPAAVCQSFSEQPTLLFPPPHRPTSLPVR